MSVWLSNKERFRREYFEGGERLDTKYLRFGKGIAKMIEEGKHKAVLPNLPVYDKPEFKIEIDILGVPMLSFLDSYNSIKNVFLEYKTGKNKWTKAKVQKHDQLLVYAVMLKHLTGKIPKFCDLIWIETFDTPPLFTDFWIEESGITLSGKVESFHRVFDKREIDRMEKLIVQTANEISAAYIKFIEEI